jgi:hypothetical protein
MDSDAKARITQMENIRKKTGKNIDELAKAAAARGLEKHTAMRDFFKTEYGLGYGDANMLAFVIRDPDIDNRTGLSRKSEDDALSEIYQGKKAQLRPLHDAVMERMSALWEFEIAPKKKYLSLRRKKQFAMVGPGTRGRLEIGINMKDAVPGDRLEALPPGGMYQYRVFLTEESQIDDELLAWLQTAFDSAG